MHVLDEIDNKDEGPLGSFNVEADMCATNTPLSNRTRDKHELTSCSQKKSELLRSKAQAQVLVRAEGVE